MLPIPQLDLPALASTCAMLITAYLVAGWFAKSAVLPDGRNRMGCIDGLRGWLALAVAATHFYNWHYLVNFGTWSVPDNLIFNSFGSVAFNLFFMITASLFYSRVSKGIVNVNWPGLYVSRFFRLVPIMWLVTLVVAVLTCMRGARGPFDLDAPLQWMFFIGSPDLFHFPYSGLQIGQAWTLKYEWLFYFFLPVLALLVTMVRALRLPPVILVLSLLCVTCYFMDVSLPPWKLVCLPPFAFGMLAYEISRVAKITQLLRSRWATIAGFIALAISIGFFPMNFVLPQDILLMFFFTTVLAGNDYWGVLRTRNSLYLGEISYDIYLLHNVIISMFVFEGHALEATLLPSAVFILMPPMIMAVIVVASLARTFVELPGIRLGHRLRDWITARIQLFMALE